MEQSKTSFWRTQEQKLKQELASGTVTEVRVEEILEELEWIRLYKKATPMERFLREKEIGKSFILPDYTPEKGIRYGAELNILREGRNVALREPK